MIKNPFLKSIRLTLYKKKKVTSLYEHGELSKVSSSLLQDIEWEKESYVKVYTGNDIQNLYKELHATSCKFILYIQLNLKPNTDLIELNTEACMSFLGIDSRTTFYKYLQRLSR